MSEIMTFPADGTAVTELPRTYPFGPAVSWRTVRGSRMGDFLVRTSTSDPISTIPLVIFLSSEFVSIWLAGHWILQ